LDERSIPLPNDGPGSDTPPPVEPPEQPADIASEEPAATPSSRLAAEPTAQPPAETATPVAGTDPGDPLWCDPEPLLVRWVVVGLLVMAGLHAVIVFGVMPLLPSGASGPGIGLGVIPYLVGGALVGALSRERSLLHPFYAAVPSAATFAFLVEVIRVRATVTGDMGRVMADIRWLAVLAPLLGYVLVAMLAAWIGERLRWGRPVSG
jgi:hypothetical protein